MLEKITSYLFLNQTTGQTIVKNITWLSIGKLGSRVLRIFIVVYAARVLGATQWGVFSYAITLVGVFAVLTDFGISPILTREVSKDSSRTDRVISTALYLKLFLLSPAVIFICFFASALPVLSGVSPLLLCFALILVLDSFRQLGFSIIKAQQRMEIQAMLYLLTNACIVAVGFLLLLQKPAVSSITYAYLIGSAVGVTTTWLYLRSYISKLFSAFDISMAREMLVSAWPFAITVSLASIMMSTDIFILGFLKPVQDVGIYSVADRVIQLLYAPALIIATSIFPVLARLAHKHSPELRTLVGKTVRLMLLALIPASIAGIIIAPWAIPLVFGQEYALSVLPVQILLTTVAVRFVSTLLSHAIFAFDARKTLVIYAISGIMLNAILDLLLIPSLGIVGAALATSIVQLCGLAYLWHSFRILTSTQAAQDDIGQRP